MTPVNLEIHPLAIAEARAARRWYHRRSAMIAQRFLAELDRAVSRITSAPQSFSSYLHGTRFLRLARFPYLIVYEDTPTVVHIIADAHAKRRPGYWRRRVS